MASPPDSDVRYPIQETSAQPQKQSMQPQNPVEHASTCPKCSHHQLCSRLIKRITVELAFFNEADPKTILLSVNIRLKSRRLETEITQTNPLVKQIDPEVPIGSSSYHHHHHYHNHILIRLI